MFYIVLFLGTLLLPSTHGECYLQASSLRKNCMIICHAVADGAQPGREAAQLAIDQKGNCEYTTDGGDNWELEFSRCVFPDDKVDADSFMPYTPGPSANITAISFLYMNVVSIHPDAFSQNTAVASTLRHFAVRNCSSFVEITNNLFEGTNLSTFLIESSGPISRFDTQLFGDASSKLKDLSITWSSGFTNVQSLANLTGKCQQNSYPTLESIVMYRADPYESLSTLSHDMFSALKESTKFKTLDLHKSQIQHFEDNTVFESLGGIKFMDLSDNLFTTIPEGVFDPLILLNPLGIEMDLSGNPWHCDCNLKYLQDLFTKKSAPKTVTPFLCASPASEAGKDVRYANLDTECNEPPQVPRLNIQC